MRCGECAFFNQINETSGECRESPPKAFMVPVRTMAGDGIGFQAIFPQCSIDVWCGAFEDVVSAISEARPLLNQ